MEKRLDRTFYRQDAVSLAQALLGKVLCVGGKRARIIETEAYGGVTDKACHSYNNRRTARTEVMYRDGGHAYVYLIYGIHYLFNVVANGPDVPEAVLVRSALTSDGMELVGPGRVSKHLGIDKSYNGADLVTDADIYIADDGFKVGSIGANKRVNIDYAGVDKDRLWRFFLKK
ncbi:MAG TPA: DNA-3-methyladenine glycosylase [Acholeplasmataceae bacterium]|jgi:DNA-3-methyladenine glycosylase|nr:DNA-3-methyladenine glycosylase [Acholeplasmataceae bacterium]